MYNLTLITSNLDKQEVNFQNRESHMKRVFLEPYLPESGTRTRDVCFTSPRRKALLSSLCATQLCRKVIKKGMKSDSVPVLSVFIPISDICIRLCSLSFAPSESLVCCFAHKYLPYRKATFLVYVLANFPLPSGSLPLAH